MRRRTLLRRAIMRQQREDKGKQERAEISHPRAKLRRWSRGSEKRRSAEFAVARRLWFCRAAKCEERLRGRFPGRRAPVEGGAAVLQRDQAGQGGGNTPAAWKSWGGGAHLRRSRGITEQASLGVASKRLVAFGASMRGKSGDLPGWICSVVTVPQRRRGEALGGAKAGRMCYVFGWRLRMGEECRVAGHQIKG